MIELLGKLSLGVPAVIAVFLLTLWMVGVFDEKVETPDILDISNTPIEPEEVIIPTEPDCENSLYVTIYRYDLRTGEFDWHMYEGDMKCHNIDAYKESPDFAVEYDNGFWLEVD